MPISPRVDVEERLGGRLSRRALLRGGGSLAIAAAFTAGVARDAAAAGPKKRSRGQSSTGANGAPGAPATGADNTGQSSTKVTTGGSNSSPPATSSGARGTGSTVVCINGVCSSS